MKIKTFNFLVIALSAGIIALGAGSLLADDHSGGFIKKNCEKGYSYCEHDCQRELAHALKKYCIHGCRKVRDECKKM